MKRPAITILLSTLLLVIGMVVFSHSPAGKKFIALHVPSKTKTFEVSEATIHKINLNASDAKSFVIKNHYNQEFCFLIDMSIASGQKRFFCL